MTATDPTPLLDELVAIAERTAAIARQVADHHRRPSLTREQARDLCMEGRRLRSRHDELRQQLNRTEVAVEDVADPIVFAWLWWRWREEQAGIAEGLTEARMVQLLRGEL